MTATAARAGLIALYAVGVLAGAPLAGPTLTPGFLAIWSGLFAWMYLRGARGSATAVVAAVAAATIALPLAALAALFASHASPFASIASAGSALIADGPRRFVELVAPLVAAAVVALACVRGKRRPI